MAMYTCVPRRPRVLMWGCIFTTLSLLFLYAWQNSLLGVLSQEAGAAADVATVLAYGMIGAVGGALAVPQYVIVALAALLGWIGFGARVRGLTLTSGILLCVALVLRITTFFLLVLPIVLIFVGFAAHGRAQAQAQAEAEEQRRRSIEDEKLNRQIEAMLARGIPLKNPPPTVCEVTPIPERREGESEGDRLGRLGVQAERWQQKKSRLHL